MYLTIEDAGNRFFRIQKKLQIKGYHNAQSGLFNSLASYLINEEFQFRERVHEIYHWIRAYTIYGGDKMTALEKNTFSI